MENCRIRKVSQRIIKHDCELLFLLGGGIEWLCTLQTLSAKLRPEKT